MQVHCWLLSLAILVVLIRSVALGTNSYLSKCLCDKSNVHNRYYTCFTMILRYYTPIDYLVRLEYQFMSSFQIFKVNINK